MGKKIGFPLLSLFLAFRSYEMVKGLLIDSSTGLTVFESAILAFLLFVFLTGVFAFPGFVFAASRLLPDAYFRIRNPKLLKRIYGLLGVDVFKRMLLFAYWGKEKYRKKYFDGRQSEFGHLGAFILISFVSFLLLEKGHTLIFLMISVVNIIGNFYPILLQRVHRIRIQRITGTITF
ncbi:hypothetical protein [Cyclobacterium sp.]|uniref:glycosyl-4,4'-diaponeurosporenoate acyltransferase CrtO family protein n=1 Tax=Cyclobacterium sp. TaxID=1966343 RepID=UPI0019901A8C|nr:hypothetical protein [Cyclobacterium sp.]MBD3628204.1 hypothetical protein [Cyclobacterium sp.]